MSERAVLVTSVGEASGSKPAAAALACAAAGPDRCGLLIDVGGRAPRPTLVASTAARELEERLAAHLPHLCAASRGQTCHLAVPTGPDAFEVLPATLPLVRDSVAVVHLPPSLLQEALAHAGSRAAGVLLRADLEADRALTALAARALIERGLVVRTLKRPLAWVPSRRALFGVLPADGPGGLPARLRAALLDRGPAEGVAQWSTGATITRHDDSETDPAGIAQRQRGDHEGAG